MSREDLPEGWAEVTLGEISRIDMGQSPDGDATNTERRGLPLVGGAADLQRGIVVPSRHTDAPTKVSEPGDLILCIRATIGKLAVGEHRYCLGRGVAGLRAGQAVERDYLRHFLGHRTRDLAELGTGSTFVQVDKKTLSDFPTPLPPLPEQRRIVARIDALQARSRAARAALAEASSLLDMLRQSVLAAAFRGDLTAEWRAKNPGTEPASRLLERIRAERKRRWQAANPKKPYVEPEPVDDSELPELPEGWCWARLEQVVTDFDYGTSAKSSDVGKIPVLRMGNLQDGEIDWSDLKYTSDTEEIKNYLLTPNTVLFNRTNSPELVGKTAIYRGERPAIFAGYLIRISLLNRVVPDFINYNLNSLQGRDWCWSVKSDGVSQSNISASKLKNYITPICPEREQTELVKVVKRQLNTITQLTTLIKSSITELDTLDQSILARAFRGELVEQDPADEPATALLARIRAAAQGGLFPGRR